MFIFTKQVVSTWRGVGGDADEIVVRPFGDGGEVHECGDGFAASCASWHEDEWVVACFGEFHEGGRLRVAHSACFPLNAFAFALISSRSRSGIGAGM